MKGKCLCVFVILLTAASAQLSFGAQSESQKVEQTIQGFFKALSTSDFLAVRNLCGEDFVLFEDGRILSLTEFIGHMKTYAGKGSISYSLTDIKPTVEKSFAWATLRNKATISIPGLPPTMEWIESAVLKKQSGRWKIAFYHSSIAKPAKLSPGNSQILLDILLETRL
jgi:ketosteroid isomerase-like protein